MDQQRFQNVLNTLTGIDKLPIRAGCVRRILQNEHQRPKKMLSPRQLDVMRRLYIKTRVAIIDQRRKESAA